MNISIQSIDKKQFIWSVLGFNLGIELVQILIVLISFPVILFISNKYKSINSYRLIISLFVIAMAGYWFYERVKEVL